MTVEKPQIATTADDAAQHAAAMAESMNFRSRPRLCRALRI